MNFGERACVANDLDILDQRDINSFSKIERLEQLIILFFFINESIDLVRDKGIFINKH